MKRKMLGAALIASLMVAAGGVSANAVGILSAERAAKPAQAQKVTYTDQQCMQESFEICGDLHPTDPLARWQCISERRDTICEGLPGTP